ncbi:peptide ABC transporter substrate-binding protein [Frondihabitans sucicola]|uniref:Peptide ABC transporter substrate-binding protein n=1 Tax=Frondihabitans sucicola TaxID=1268041 RepID=A0ABM8GK08_9MICO|nr:ABC transporter substrate-binding protein [Frondihabitans sucicola]BDZ48726.1 peptide ABC transporter substrate-binding protein [Frondihabitans sucicola]
MMISRKRGVLAALAGAAALAVALTGCTSSASTTNSASGPTLAVYNGASGAFVKNFNPLSPTVLSNIQGLIYEPMFFYNNLASLATKPKPLLGQSFSFNADGTVLSVTLKSGVTWSDGKPFTASDVAFTMNLIRTTPALNTSGNTPVAKVVDPTHVTLTFAHPSFTSAPTILGTTYIVPEHIWKSVKEPATYINSSPVGTGPMEMSSFTNQSYLLKKNPDFRDAKKLEVGGLRVYSLSGNEAATNKLLAKQLDWAGIFVPDVKKVLDKPNLGYTFYGDQQVVLNTCSNTALGCTGPQTDPVVRQAMAAAIDRNQVNKLAYYGNAVPISATFGLPKRDKAFIAPEYASTEPMSANTAKAESLLEGAGWVKGSDGIYAKNGQKLSMNVLVTSGYTDYIAALQAITQQFKQAGIEIQVQQVANQENNSAAGLGKFQLQINGIFQGPAPDPYYVYDKYFGSENTSAVGKSGNPYANVSRFSNKTVDAALATAAGTQDQAVKAKAYATIQGIITKDLPYIPIIDNRNFAEYSTTQVTGFPTTSNLYAQPAPNVAPDNEVVLLNLKKK